MGPLTCPYPLNVQACPPRDQRPALRFRVSVLGKTEGKRGNLEFWKRPKGGVGGGGDWGMGGSGKS